MTLLAKTPLMAPRTGRRHRWLTAAHAVLIGLVAGLAALPAQSAVDIAQVPLFLRQDVPGNLLLTPSVEFPTNNVAAYQSGFATVGTNYTGLFDSRFCYAYRSSTVESERYFEPMAMADANGACTGKLWSGKYMNWATTQAVEPFRIALTGGNRVRDTATETWIQKARQDGQGSYFGDRQITGTQVTGYAPAASGWSNSLWIRINGLDDKARITSNGDLRKTAVPYNPDGLSGLSATPLNSTDTGAAYELSIRVQVCKKGFLSPNCVAYGSNYKPEGLIQEYSKRLRYGAFGYLKDSTTFRDGAVLRANQKFVGPQIHNPLVPAQTNSEAEWDAATGVIVDNPNPNDARASNVARSGVINFINKFGEDLNGGHKGKDPVSEMYYAATRYLRKLPPVPEYSKGATTAMKDGLPVIDTWNDPIQYSCQANVILGIGDAYTHRDKNLPGPTDTSDEPAKPAAVVADTAVNVVDLLGQVFKMEGLSNNPAAPAFYGSNYNSAYIAALAYDMHVRDQRTESNMPGKQTVSTYWVDVRENNKIEPRARNQYWLATKYGGFRVPDGYQPGTAPAQASWNATGEKLETGDLRPDNYFVASNPDAMISSLKQAFAKIASELALGGGAALGVTGESVEGGSSVFQGTFFGGEWSGDVAAYDVSSETGLASTPSWRATERFSQRAADDATWWQVGKRKVLMSSGTGLVDFSATSVASAYAGIGLTADMVNYLRGDRSKEAYVDGALRPRGSVLGPVIGSAPLFVDTTTATSRRKMVYVGADDGMLHAFYADNGTSATPPIGQRAGDEAFAFVPKAAISQKLKAYTQYSSTGFAHQYLVDGELTAANVTVNGAERTYLVGTMGRGDPGAFALDVTDPANPTLLWDKTGSDIPALGNSLGKPVIAQIAAGNWSAVIGNGPNGNGGDAAAIIVGLAGATRGVATTINVGGGPDNGLSAPEVWRSGASQYFDTIYAGDLNGVLWRIRNIATGAAGTGDKVRVYTAQDAAGVPQPITAAPLVAARPRSNDELWIFFGTGRFLSSSDVGNKQVQTWYGIKDGAAFTGLTNLVQRSITAQEEVVVTPDDPSTPANETVKQVFRSLSSGTSDELLSKRGWYMNLVPPGGAATGERMVIPNRFRGLLLRGTTRIPDARDPCSPGGAGFEMDIDPFTGAPNANGSGFIDMNQDGVIDDSDKLSNGEYATGRGFDTGTYQSIDVSGHTLRTTTGGDRSDTPTPPSTVPFKRVNWREIILNTRSTP